MLDPQPVSLAVDREIVFVTGASRSGTTLLNHVLGNHSRILGLQELHYFGDLWNPVDKTAVLGEGRLHAVVATLLARQESGIYRARVGDEAKRRTKRFIDAHPGLDRSPQGLFAEVATHLAKQAGREIPCEQTPRNIFYAETLLRTYPNARFIHMMRDPRAVMASQKMRWQRRRLATDRKALPPHATLRSWANYHPYTMARLWLKASSEAARLGDDPRFLIVRFEDLLTGPEATVRRICDHLRIEFEPALLDVRQINSSHQSSVGGARKGLHPDAVDAWKRTLTAGERNIAERLCHTLMTRFGYAPGKASRGGQEIRHALSYPFHLAGVLAVNPRRAWIQFRAVYRRP